MSEIEAKVIDVLEAAIDEKITKAVEHSKGSLHSAQVSKIDNDGFVWVRLVGASTDTPVGETTTAYNLGDIVSVRITNGVATIVGNFTQPAIGDREVENFFTNIVEPPLNRQLEAIAGAADAAEAAAREANNVVAATNQHFWKDDDGAHITDDTQVAFAEAETQNFPDWQPDDTKPNYKPWYNVLLNSLGQVFRTANKILASFTRSAIAFYDGEGNSDSNIIAQFGKDGARIGKMDSNHVILSDSGMGVFSGSNYSNVNGVDVVQTSSDASTAKSDASTAKSTAATAKSTADTAKSTADTAKTTADAAKTAASSATTTANNASKAADEAKEVANKTKENFWADTSGVHVSTNASKADGAFNSLFTSTGLLFRKAANNLLSLTGSALNFYDGSGNNAANVLASFGSTVQLGKIAEYHYYGTSNSFGLYPGGNNTAANALFYVNNTPSVRIGKQAANTINTLTNTNGFYIRSNTTNVGSFTYESVKELEYAVGPGYTFGYSSSSISDGGFDVLRLTPGKVYKDNLNPFLIPATIASFGTEDQGGVAWNGGLSVGLWADIANGLYIERESEAVFKFGSQAPIQLKYGDKYGSSMRLGAGGLTIIGSGEFAENFYNLGNFVDTSETLHLGSDTATYIYSNGQTIANRLVWEYDTTGQLTLPTVSRGITDIFRTMSYTGGHAMHSVRNNDITLTTTNAAAPSASTYNGIYTRDSANNIVGACEHVAHTNGNSFMNIYARRWNPTTKAIVSNALVVGVNAAGEQIYTVSNQTAFRTAIGAHNASNLTTGTVPRARIENTAWAYLVGSASATNYVRWRMVAGWVAVEVHYASGAGLSTTSKKFATVPANYRPSKYVTIACLATGNNVAWLGVDTDGSVNGAVRSGTAAAVYGSIIYPLG